MFTHHPFHEIRLDEIALAPQAATLTEVKVEIAVGIPVADVAAVQPAAPGFLAGLFLFTKIVDAR